MKINPWGVMVIVAVIAAILTAIIRARRYGIPSHRIKKALHLVIIVVAAAFFGARLFFILEHFHSFTQYPREFLTLKDHSGLSWYGGLLFAFAVGFLSLKKAKSPIGVVLDTLAPGIALGVFFGRIGCFLKGCCFGKPTLVPWGVIFSPDSYAAGIYGEHVALHPTQLYSSFAALLSFFLLLLIEKKIRLKGQGLIFFCFLVLYGTWRFIIEFFRFHDEALYLAGWFTKGHAFSIAVIVIGIAMIWQTIKRQKDTATTNCTNSSN